MLMHLQHWRSRKPGFSFTTGFAATIGHPELIGFKMGRETVNEIFWLIYRCAQNGKPVPQAMRVGGLLRVGDAYVFQWQGATSLITSAGADGCTAATTSNACRWYGLMKAGYSRGSKASTQNMLGRRLI